MEKTEVQAMQAMFKTLQKTITGLTLYCTLYSFYCTGTGTVVSGTVRKSTAYYRAVLYGTGMTVKQNTDMYCTYYLYEVGTALAFCLSGHTHTTVHTIFGFGGAPNVSLRVMQNGAYGCWTRKLECMHDNCGICSIFSNAACFRRSRDQKDWLVRVEIVWRVVA